MDDFDDVEDPEDEIHVDSSERAFLASADWTVETLLDQLRQGNIELSPDFQRRSVWDDRRASRFIESIVLGLPIPQLMLAEDKNKPGGFLVLDGKQRLISLARFASQLAAGSSTSLSPLRLKGLDQLTELEGLTYQEFKDDPTFSAAVRRFKNQTIRTVVIAGWPNTDWLNLVFLRLNSGSVPLSGQELRQALNPGAFTIALNEYSTASVELQSALGLSAPDFRMRDTELALRFVAFRMYLNDYAGTLKRFLDQTTNTLNSNWTLLDDRVQETFNLLDMAIKTARIVHGVDAFHRYNGASFENRFNRAVFDAQSLIYSIPEISDAARNHGSALRDEYVRLCREDRDFAESLQSTTKSIDATATRLSKWAESVGRICNLTFPMPQVVSIDGSRRILWEPLDNGVR